MRQLLLLQPARDEQRQQQQHEREQQHGREQQQAWRSARLLEMQLQHLSELQQLQEAGLLPGYAAEELSGLGLEELDEILVGVQQSPSLATSLPHSGSRHLL